VDFSNADLSALPGAEVRQGATVQVRGTLAEQRISADRIIPEPEIRGALATDARVSLQGPVANLVDAGQFTVNGVPVDAGSAALEPADLVLERGSIVQVDGAWNGQVLTATTLRSRGGFIGIKASLSEIDAAARTLTLSLHGGALTVRVDAHTQIEDSTHASDRLGFGGLRSGDIVAVRAFESGGELLATSIDRRDAPGDILQARVESFTADSEITLLGISFETRDTRFLGRGDRVVDSQEFYAQLQVGDVLRVRDGGVPDGVADVVVFELRDALDP
jgi:hypothetical protein